MNRPTTHTVHPNSSSLEERLERDVMRPFVSAHLSFLSVFLEDWARLLSVRRSHQKRDRRVRHATDERNDSRRKLL